MATLKSKAKAQAEDETQEMFEEAVSESITLSDEEEPQVFNMLCGYKDENGVNHTEFTLREMTGKDEEAVSKADVRNSPSKVITVLLTRCLLRIGTITPKTVGREQWNEIIRNLYVGDQDYILMQLRKISLGEEIEVTNICPNEGCKTKLHSTILVDELDIEPFKGEREIKFELIKGYKDKKGVLHKTGTMRLPKGIDREVLTPLAKTNLARAETVMLTRLCKFDDGAYIDEDVMGSLSIRDRECLQKLLQKHNFGIKQEFDVTCDACGETFKSSLSATNFI